MAFLAFGAGRVKIQNCNGRGGGYIHAPPALCQCGPVRYKALGGKARETRQAPAGTGTTLKAREEPVAPARDAGVACTQLFWGGQHHRHEAPGAGTIDGRDPAPSRPLAARLTAV